ncbi:MAG: PQQ-dependent sugar dehydrogenase, partial [Candidatus Limnocylindria bacterium]
MKGGLRLEEDPTITFDSRLRRMFRAVALDGRDIGEAMARSGVVRGDGRGQRAAGVRAAEADARGAARGCAWRAPDSSFAPDDATPRVVARRPHGVADRIAEGIRDTLDLIRPDSIFRPLPAAAAPSTASFPQGFTQDVVTGGLVEPTAFAFTPDGRILVAQKSGVVRIVKAGALLPAPFIDIRDRVNDYFDHGLIGIAVDPAFATNGYVYLLYTYEDNAVNYSGPKAGRLTRVTATGDVAAPSTEVVLLGTVVGGSCNNYPIGADCIPSDDLSHSVGNIKFAPDGTMFVTTGDGSSFTTVDANALRSQNLDSLAGKMLHITTTGAAAPGNPYWNGDPTSNRSKVWAYGIRNSFRFNIRPATGTPFIGDVGWNDQEEINVGVAGANFGWPCYEGGFVQTGYQSFPACQALYAAESARAPLLSYGHATGGAAVTGGAFYVGTVYPTQYQGAFFYGDYAQGFMRTLRLDAGDALVPGSPASFATGTDGPVDIESGPDQNLYYLAINTGELRRIRYVAGGNTPPTAVAAASPTNGLAPLAVSFSSAGSFDPDANPLSYSWNFGDSTPASTAANPSHTYTTNGTYTATLTVSDGLGGTGTATARVIVGDLAPTATISAPSSALTYRVGDVITFAGSATDREDGNLPPSSLTWQIVVHHCPQSACHTHFLLNASGSGGQFTVPDHGDDSYFELILTATDSVGLTGRASVSISPQTKQITIATSPVGLQVAYDGTTGAAPLVRNSVVGSVHTLTAPSPQANATFASWSDGGAQQHNFVVGTTNTTFTATFNVVPSASLVLNGTSYASAPHRAELNTTGDWTVEAWFRDETPGGYNHDTQYILMKGNTDNDAEAPYLIGVAWNGLFAGERTGWANNTITAPLSVSANAWHHVAAVFVASTRQVTIYLDGAPAVQGTIAARTTSGSPAPIEIGRNGSGSSTWRGKLDDIRIWNVTRTAAQIAASYQTELS